jgi:S-adenosylmethionine synthetase
MNKSDEELIFVYNADSEAGSLIKDYFHKTFKPSTYPCNLAKVTHGIFGVKRSWKEFIESISISTRFLYKNEFNKKFDITGAELPCIYLRQNKDIKLFINNEIINNVDTVEELKDYIIQTLVEFDL